MPGIRPGVGRAIVWPLPVDSPPNHPFRVAEVRCVVSVRSRECGRAWCVWVKRGRQRRIINDCLLLNSHSSPADWVPTGAQNCYLKRSKKCELLPPLFDGNSAFLILKNGPKTGKNRRQNLFRTCQNPFGGQFSGNLALFQCENWHLSPVLKAGHAHIFYYGFC